ncbi:disintegrin and metalloproteinase domain-containing protein 9-like isoform X1 [Limulus polyphemus]|uniref:Disintegrin and metalloproteinase domain-containing protein 9-like isoform X1 n=1 Tax=Limulus polyphemus TaxID=6850 RepID=A0ABM1TAQ5_LIMPO|nr:disintegrin and metalloproteinase domain-containing protein 9-like isoform X1 [Limulus polyphemus]
MHWIYIALFFLCYGAPCRVFAVSRRKRDIDEALGHEEDNKRREEVSRLKRQYPENEKLLNSIPSRFYNVIYPYQLRHQRKMGISTRDVNKDGEHFNETEFRIKAFNYILHLQLKLNTNLLAPNLYLKKTLPEGRVLVSHQKIEHCYYHGFIKDYPGAKVAFRTCNGISGVIHIQNETFVIHPFYGGDFSMNHPHVIFKHMYFSEKKGKNSCGNSDHYEWSYKYYRKPSRISFMKYKRDVRLVNKYVELALVLDQAMFDSRNTSVTSVINDAVQIINCVDMYFSSINTEISIVYIETWGHDGDQMEVVSNVRQTLLSFMGYVSRKLFKVAKDATHLLTGRSFGGMEVGMAVPDTICTEKAVGVSQDSNIYEPHLTAITVTHMLGHNLGLSHDTSEDCKCQDWWGCIMSASVLGKNQIQPYHFSTCSKEKYVYSLKSGHAICLLNKPNQLHDFTDCGNGKIEGEEECDCGNFEDCKQNDPCCDPITCKLKMEAECAMGDCCDRCKLRAAGQVCRPVATECDIPEACDGKSGQCPPNLYRKNGDSCADGNGYCFQGNCPTTDKQCSYIWGYGGVTAQDECFKFNMQGIISGHCGSDGKGGFISCSPDNMRCGSLQCQRGAASPLISGMNANYTRTIASIEGVKYECKITSGTISKDIPDMGMVADGSKCGENRICINQSCVDVITYRSPGTCPTNNIALNCSGHGVCSNVNTCHCQKGWTSPDCSQRVKVFDIVTTPPPVPTEKDTKVQNSWKNSTSGTTKYVEKEDSLSASSLVIVLVSVVGGVFIFFALLATCYRRKSNGPKHDSAKGQNSKTSGPGSALGKDDEESSHENVSRMITFGSMPSYREDKLHEMRRQQLRKNTSCSEGEEVDLLDEMSTFIELSPNNLSKVPERGILKHGDGKEKWSDEASQSDNQDILSQSDNRDSDQLTEVERNLKSMNGYHEEILEALHSASSHRPQPDTLTSPCQEHLPSFGQTVGDYGSLQFMKSSSPEEQLETESGDEVEETVPPCGPIRIRNLEDLLRQLEHQPGPHTSPEGSEDIRLSEPEADRHYHLDHPRLFRPTPRSENCFSPYSEVEEDEEEDNGREEEEEDVDEDGSGYASPTLVRSASEEALPVTVKKDYSYERNLNTRQHDEKALKRETCDYFPSPPSDTNSYEEEASSFHSVPPASHRPVEPLPAPTSSTTGAQPISGAKRKTKKKFPEYKI